MSRGTADVFDGDMRRPAYAVLAYHQVVEDGDGLEHAVSAQRFSAQIAFLREHGDIVSVAELLKRRQRAARPARWTFALTFDDGYASLARVAHPILLAAGLYPPAGSVQIQPRDSRRSVLRTAFKFNYGQLQQGSISADRAVILPIRIRRQLHQQSASRSARRLRHGQSTVQLLRPEHNHAN